MATEVVTIHRVRKVFDRRKIDLLFLFMTGFMMYMLTQVETIFQALVFYGMFIVLAWLHSLTLEYLMNEKSFFLNLMDYSIYDAYPSFLIWGVGLFFILFSAYNVLGATFVWPTIADTYIHQLFIVSAETFIFCIFIVKAMPKYWGTIPFFKLKRKRISRRGRIFNKKVTVSSEPIRIPGWFWGAGFMFGSFHWIAYSGNLFQILMAMFFGLLWYKIYRYGEVNKKVGGAGAVICFHYIWNMLAISVVMFVFPGLFNIFFPM